MVQDAPGTLSCVERPSVDIRNPLGRKIRRRLLVRGLQDATVRFLPEAPRRDDEKVELRRLATDSEDSLRGGEIIQHVEADVRWSGRMLEVSGITGALVISW